MAFQIRPVCQGDAAILASIQSASWQAAFRDILSEETLSKCSNVDHSTAMYTHLLENNIGNGYIGELDGTPHCIAYWNAARDADMPGMAELICIHSLPENWRKGCGSQMMDRVLADIRSAGFEKVVLWVFTDNYRARAFYEAMGFSATDRTHPAFGTTEICYIKEL